MKTKLLCLLLALAMAMSCFAFAGCSDENEGTIEGAATDETALTTVTLTLWIPTDEDTTEEAILAVQEAINKITKAKFETAIELHAVPSDEYEAAIEARFTEIEENIAFEKAEAARKKQEAQEMAEQGETTAAEKETSAANESVDGEDTYVNDIGMTVVRYPEVEANQMDIFLVRGYDDYTDYINRMLLSPLDTDLSDSCKVLKQYIYPDFLTKAKVMGSTYAIPNNHTIGEYEFLLVNKRLVDELYWDADLLTTLMDCEQFILDMKEFTDVTPFAGKVEPSGLYYWSENGEWSAIASQVTADATYTTSVPPQNLLSIPAAVDAIYLQKVLEENGCTIADPASVEEFGVGIISGDASVRAQYEDDYYVYVHENPRASEEDLYASMFAVSSYTKSVSRSMEIITQINTDSELRTILQYGAEGVHWRVNDENEDVIDIISEDYKMNLIDTGNVFMTYPAAGVPMSGWDLMKAQNLDVRGNPYVGLKRTDYVTEENKAAFDAVAAASAELKARIDEMSAAEFKANLEALIEEVILNGDIAAQLDTSMGDNLAAFYESFQASVGK